MRRLVAQTREDVEVVVVDDGSTDATPELLRELERDGVVHIGNPGRGVSDARNAGARASTGDALAFLDDDDEVGPDWADLLTAPLVEEDVVLVCAGSVHRRPDGSNEVHPVRDLGPVFGNHRGQFDTGTYAVRRDVFDQAGGFASGLASGEHHELGLRLLDVVDAGGLHVALVDEPIVTIVQRPSTHRASSRAQHQYDSAQFMLTNHGHRLVKSPRLHGDYLAIAGVNAARLGQYGEARRMLRRAIRVDPRFAKHYARLVLACVPPLGRRVWRSAEFSQTG